MGKKGRNKYVPSVVIEELGDIRREDDLVGEAEAFKKMVKYSQVGREANRLMRLDWSKKRKKGVLF